MDSLLQANKYLKGTKLIIRQDSTDRFTALKGDILSQMKSSENELSEKDVKIIQLEKSSRSTATTIVGCSGKQILFPQVISLSVSHHDMATDKDSFIAITAVLYEAKEDLADREKEKLRSWLNQRLTLKDVAFFRKK